MKIIYRSGSSLFVDVTFIMKIGSINLDLAKSSISISCAKLHCSATFNLANNAGSGSLVLRSLVIITHYQSKDSQLRSLKCSSEQMM